MQVVAIGFGSGHCRAVTAPQAPPGSSLASAAEPAVAAWAGSGAMALTGWSGRPPLGPPHGLVPKLLAVGGSLRTGAGRLGGRLEVDALAVLGERAAIAGLARQGDVSCGGATRLVRCGPERLAVTLARPEDRELVPAWLELDGSVGDPWPAVAAAAVARPIDELVERALLLGLPVGLLPRGPTAGAAEPVRHTRVVGPPAPVVPLSSTVVVDLSSLWAGPLCGSLLGEAGAAVIKVESATRPDGARRGPRAFFDLLNAGKRSVALELGTPAGVAALHALLARADVVITASRARSLDQLGIDAIRFLASHASNVRVWVSITGHGLTGAGRDRVAFGDDAAVAGGLVSRDGDDVGFCADAVADPASGLFAAAGVLDALSAGGRWLLDVSMADVAAHLTGPTLAADPRLPAAPPRARSSPGTGPRLGEHSAAVLGDVGR